MGGRPVWRRPATRARTECLEMEPSARGGFGAGGSGTAAPPARVPRGPPAAATRSSRSTDGAPQEVSAQRRVERYVGGCQRVVDAVGRTARVPALQESAERAPVVLSRRRASEHVTPGLQILEPDIAAERKLDLLARQHMKHGHLVADPRRPTQLLFNGGVFVVEV